ncbi:MAG: S24/S26 family peptidase [Alistipes shahii]
MILLPNQLFFAEVEAMLAEGREVQIRMKGHSMRPLLRSERDQVVLTPCTDPARLRPGDVVLFRCCGRHILHRIVRRDGERLTLAGDGNYRITEQCTTRDVAGIAVRVIRASGRVVGCDSPAGSSDRASGSRSRPGCDGRCCACSGIRAGNEKGRAFDSPAFYGSPRKRPGEKIPGRVAPECVPSGDFEGCAEISAVVPAESRKWQQKKQTGSLRSVFT